MINELPIGYFDLNCTTRSEGMTTPNNAELDALVAGLETDACSRSDIREALDAIAALREQKQVDKIEFDNAMRELRTWAERAEKAEADNAAMREVCIDVLAHLVAAHSLLVNGGKKAAPSDKMFNQMLKDYAASIARGRAALLAGKKP